MYTQQLPQPHENRRRADIDLLRFTAATMVALYHWPVTSQAVPFGFFGVDIFLPIAGYFLASFYSKNKGQLFLYTYLKNRFFRLFPLILIAVLIICIVNLLTELPSQLKKESKDALLSITSVLNIAEALRSTDYANLNIENKKFGHFWSIACEIQLYIICALLLQGIGFKKSYYRNIIITGIILGSASLYFFVSYTQYYTYSFYSPISRLWQFSMGIIAFYIWDVPYKIDKKIKIGLVALLFLFAISFVLADFGEYQPLHRPFVSLFAISVISIGFQIPKIFEQSIFLMGSISFGMYIWHLPLASLLTNYTANNTKTTVIYFLSLILISTLSLKLIEQPLGRQSKSNTKRILYLFAITLFVTSSSIIFEGFPQRFSAALKTFDDTQPPWNQTRDSQNNNCYGKTEDYCFFNNSSDKTVFLIGDSHMASMDSQIMTTLGPDFNYVTATMGACWPMTSTTLLEPKSKRRLELCSEEYQTRRLTTLKTTKPSITVISGRLPFYLSGKGFDNGAGGVEKSEIAFATGKQSLKERMVQALDIIIESSELVVIIGPIPEAGWNVPKKLASNAFWHGRAVSAHTRYHRYRERSREAYDFLQEISNKYENVLIVHPESEFCEVEQDICRTHDETTVYYFDDDHLSNTGASIIASALKHGINKVLATTTTE